MTVEEIFKDLASHMIQGMMVHEHLANYYDFLGLEGYRECHEYHFMQETCAYRKLCRYYMAHYNKLIPDSRIDTPDVIPGSWYNYSRQDVDANTKKNAVKSGLTKWVDWETETKELYENMYQELFDLGEVSAATFLSCFIGDVDHELSKAEGYLLDKQFTNFDADTIVAEQKKKHAKYHEKLEERYRGYVC